MTTPLTCPSCGTLMAHERFAHRMRGEVALDICWGCHAIWFDQYESAQLAPSAVLSLFQQIHDHRTQTPRALREPMRCPRCTVILILTHDMQRSNRLRYHRCPDGHGRLTTFMQFLREKEFVRSLSQPEIETLKATVAQVACSSCGGCFHDTTDFIRRWQVRTQTKTRLVPRKWRISVLRTRLLDKFPPVSRMPRSCWAR